MSWDSGKLAFVSIHRRFGVGGIPKPPTGVPMLGQASWRRGLLGVVVAVSTTGGPMLGVVAAKGRDRWCLATRYSSALSRGSRRLGGPITEGCPYQSTTGTRFWMPDALCLDSSGSCPCLSLEASQKAQNQSKNQGQEEAKKREKPRKTGHFYRFWRPSPLTFESSESTSADKVNGVNGHLRRQ